MAGWHSRRCGEATAAIEAKLAELKKEVEEQETALAAARLEAQRAEAVLAKALEAYRGLQPPAERSGEASAASA
eukprot:9472442-Alexandrium_andersonii.AAC.1